MNNYEFLSLGVSLLAVTVSFVALYRSRKTHEEFLTLEKIHAEVSKKQLDEFQEKELLKQKTKIFVRMELIRSDTYEFIIQNIGESIAKDIWVRLEQGGEHNPFVQDVYAQKIPYPLLNPGEEFTLLASVPINVTQRIYPLALRWHNADGSQSKIECSVSR